MNVLRSGCILLFGMCGVACKPSMSDDILVFNSFYNFNESAYGWSAGVANYAAKDSVKVKFEFVYDNTHATSSADRRSLKLSGNNTGDYLFMFIKKQITGLTPETDYTIAFDIESSCQADGADYDNVVLKAGATAQEPLAISQGDYKRINIDPGMLGKDGRDMIVIDTLQLNADASEYGVIQSGTGAAKFLYVKSRTDSQGNIWVIIGTESPIAGGSTVYYTKVSITFSAQH